jgi:DNA sulfur modification protein DndD
MIIEKLVIENFGPFEGRNPFDLKPRDGNITIVLGDSGSGKTHFGKAIRWGLYNLPFYSSEEARKRRSEDAEEKPYDKSQILNLFYRTGGGAVDLSKPPSAREMSVAIDLRPSASMKRAMESRDLLFGTYTLTREASVPFSKTFPSWKDVDTPPMKLQGPHQRLERGENPDSVIDEFFLPSSTSIFFMFHGERIKALTQQISAPVQESINKILDVTPMKNAASDLEQINSDFLGEVETSKEKQEELNRHQDYKVKLQARLQTKRKELKDAQTNQTTLEGELRTNREQQKEVMAAMGLKEQDDKIEVNLKDARGKLKDKIELLAASRDNFTREALYHILLQDSEERKEIDEENQKTQAKISDFESEKGKLEHLKEGEACPTCTQVVGADFLKKAKSRIKELEDSVKLQKSQLKEPDPNYVQLQMVLSRLKDKKYKPETLNKELGDIRATIRNLKTRRQEIRRKIRSQGDDAETAYRLQKRERDLLEIIDRAKKEVWGLEKEVKDREKDLSELNTKIHELARGAKGKLASARADLAQRLELVFGEVVGEHAKAKKDQIAAGTGRALLELTIKPYLFSKDPIKINDQFELSTYNSKGNELLWDVDSTGERGILSLAFIYGLLKASERDAPVILDTAFGNLAPGHLKNISRLLPTFGPQVILLLTLLEYKALLENAEKDFWNHVDKYIVLCHHSAANESTQVTIVDDFKSANKEFEKEFEESISANKGARSKR